MQVPGYSDRRMDFDDRGLTLRIVTEGFLRVSSQKFNLGFLYRQFSWKSCEALTNLRHIRRLHLIDSAEGEQGWRVPEYPVLLATPRLRLPVQNPSESSSGIVSVNVGWFWGT